MDGHELRRTLAVHDRIARIYQDDRFPAGYRGAGDLRMFAITVVWVAGIERLASNGDVWPRVYEILGLNDWRFWRLIEQDVPRYEPPGDLLYGRQCEAPMIRKPGLCGKRGCTWFRVTDPSDGTWRIASYCTRHEALAAQVHAAQIRQAKAGGVPEPFPNAGGLLPSYFGWDWPKSYAIAKPGWKPPAAGIRADDWPALAKVAEMAPPTLSVLAGEREGEAAPRPSGLPSLRLLT